MICCSASDKTEGLCLGNRQRGEGLWAGYLVSDCMRFSGYSVDNYSIEASGAPLGSTQLTAVFQMYRRKAADASKSPSGSAE